MSVGRRCFAIRIKRCAHSRQVPSLSLVQTVPLPPVDHSRLPVILSRFLLAYLARLAQAKERKREGKKGRRSTGKITTDRKGGERTAGEERNNDRLRSLLLSLASRGWHGGKRREHPQDEDKKRSWQTHRTTGLIIATEHNDARARAAFLCWP